MWPMSNPAGMKIIATHAQMVIANQIRIDRSTTDFTLGSNSSHFDLAAIGISYRNFKVVSAKSAKISARIQNRMMILDSDQPASSK
jgi:hypothetical protein